MRQESYRPGTLNVKVNGIQIEDLYQEWCAYKKANAELKERNKEANEMLRKQGEIIQELKERIKAYEENTTKHSKN